MRTTLFSRQILLIGLLAIAVAGVGCASTLKVRKATIGEAEVEGVPFYFPTQLERRFVLTKLKKPDGTFTNRCEHVGGVEKVVVPDYSQVYLIRQDTQFFSSNILAVTLNDGVLTSVNATSDPQFDEAVTALSGLAQNIGGLALAHGANLAPQFELDDGEVLADCNDGKRILPPQ